MAQRISDKFTIFLISLALIVTILIAYEPIRHNEFVGYDDDKYITENPNVREGTTRDSVIWAFTKYHYHMWHPLTTLSHMLDCEIYGLNPLGHHITSLLIHIANSLLLFLLLSKMTGAVWPSAFVAAAFALHPLQVESVAWAAERKTVLSGLFWFLTMAVYIWYTKRPGTGRYTLLCGVYGLCIMTKPVVVTLPFALLLLDYWPLDRVKWGRQIENTKLSETTPNAPSLQKASVGWLVTEKVPLFALSAVLSIVTFVAQQRAGAVKSLEFWPLRMRVINAMGSYSNYIAKMLYPKDLAVLYPFPEKMTIDAAVLAVMGVTVLLVLWRRGRPWLVVGLLWYLGTLVPVIGLVQSGEQIMADRYAYLPSIGVFLVIAWGADEIFSKMRYSKTILVSGAAAVLIAMVLLTRIQVGYWRDSLTLFGRAVAVTKNNFVMHCNYGSYLCTQGQFDEGIRHFKEAARIYPEYLPARKNICTALLEQGKLDEAITCFTEVLEERNDWPNMHQMYNELGRAYELKGNLTLAETNYRKALTLQPDYKPAADNLARVLAKQGKIR
ncbi:MAG: tetratricopeptide repeat protein [Sedimentisphaerales bacterium]